MRQLLSANRGKLGMSECDGLPVDRAKVHRREPAEQRLQTPCIRALGQGSVLAICASWSCCGRVQFGQFIRLRSIRYVAVKLEFVQHLAPSTMQPSFHCPDGTTDHHSNLVVGLTLFMEQDEHFPIIIPQRIDRGLQRSRQLFRAGDGQLSRSDDHLSACVWFDIPERLYDGQLHGG